MADGSTRCSALSDVGRTAEEQQRCHRAMTWLSRQARRLFYGGAVFLGVWALVGVVRLLASPGPLWIRVDRPNGFAPTKVIVDVHVVPADGDRTLWLMAESDDEESRSEIPLFDGAQSRRTYHWVWNVRTPGEYLVSARVGNVAGIRASAQSVRLIIP